MACFPDANRVKTYGIFPAFELRDADDPRVQTSIALVTDMVVSALRAGGDPFHFVVDWRDPGSAPWQNFTDGMAEPHLVMLSDPARLGEVVRMSVDPFSPESAGAIRSIATCRAATFGYDGQAFLCLRHEDQPPVASDGLVIVEERPELLIDSDYFDGYISRDPADADF